MPGDDPSVLTKILRPYRSKFNRSRCRHADTVNVNLGYDFITDMLVLEFHLDRNRIDIGIDSTCWLSRAGQSLAEALRLAACQELDIEFTELVTGYRIRRNPHEDYVDVYLYDSLSSGAGYAVGMASQVQALLTKTRKLLEGCDCETACHNCLKHYRNQFVHGMLDRHAALNLLDWGEKGKLPTVASLAQQRVMIQPLVQILQRSGLQVIQSSHGLQVQGRLGKKDLVIYPAFLARPRKPGTLFISDAELKYAKPTALKTISDSV